jgi:membrane-bound serine protease (ClpP class)
VPLVIILLVVGVVLLLLEAVLPGLVAGILGFCCLVAGIALGYARFDARTANLILVATLIVMVGGFACWVKFFPESRMGKVFVSKRVVGNIDAEQVELLHQTGVAYTPLRPSGTAQLNGKRIDVVTEGPFVERGTPIKVVAVEGVRVVVRALTEPQSNLPETKSITS